MRVKEETAMKFTLSYLEIDRLGKLEGLKANAASPMHDLAPVINQMQKNIEPQVLEKLDDLLSEQKLIVNEDGNIKAVPEIRRFLKALFAPEKCFHTRMNEPGGCSATYYIPFDGAWARLDAVRGQLSIAFPLPQNALDICLTADVQATLKGENIRLLAERREMNTVHSAVIMNDDNGYAFIGNVVDKKEHSCTEYIHSFAKTEENIMWIADMLSGKREFVLPESERENAKPTEKRSYKNALKGFLIALAVNVCAAIIIAVLKAVL